MKLSVFFFIVALLAAAFSTRSSGSGSGSSTPLPRPNVDRVADFARWLVASATWGILATVDEVGRPFGYVASYSDADSGIPYFYLSTLDPAGTNLQTDARSSFTVTEAELGNCSDPQSPTCGKITLLGEVVPVDPNSEEAEVATAALFAEHPLFNRFPKINGTFAVYKLVISRIFLVNKSAPRRNLTVEEYLAVVV